MGEPLPGHRFQRLQLLPVMADPMCSISREPPPRPVQRGSRQVRRRALATQMLKVLDSPAYEAVSSPEAPAVYNTLCRSSTIEVFKDRLVIVPVVGTPPAVRRT
jgi:hypothetical protein